MDSQVSILIYGVLCAAAGSILVSYILNRKYEKLINDFALVHVITIGGESPVVRSIATEAYNTHKEAVDAMNFIINDLTSDNSGKNIYYTSLTGQAGADYRELTIREVKHIFKIQKLTV